MVAAHPDLIVGMPSPVQDILGELSALAPVVGLDWNATWRGS